MGLLLVPLAHPLTAEPLRLAFEAMRTLLPLNSFIGAGDLAVEKIWYQIVARSVDLGEYTLGLRASASLQMCNKQLQANLPGGSGGKPSETKYLELEKEDKDASGTLRLLAFAPPGTSASLDIAKLVSGASLNACRCCLEVGTREALRLLTGELGGSAGMWVERVKELGDSAKAGKFGALNLQVFGFDALANS